MKRGRAGLIKQGNPIDYEIMIMDHRVSRSGIKNTYRLSPRFLDETHEVVLVSFQQEQRIVILSLSRVSVHSAADVLQLSVEIVQQIQRYADHSLAL